MKPQDSEMAKQKLTKENLSLVIVKKGTVVFETKKQGVTGFLQAIESLNQNLVEASVADKIVGVAAALLCVYSGVSAVFALTISDGGIEVLKENKIACFYDKKVPHILNRNKDDVCPFEKLATSSKSPEDAYVKLKSLAQQMSAKSKKTSC